ncbi:hypothetical protein [Streptomyces torulosus]|uniref:hypothetical protein n=1 Tax=Streptomyces torulosus TaxID=68276 RepID=UPI0006EBCE98|nr:hypothetical protein [Streptomyces torulosus]
MEEYDLTEAQKKAFGENEAEFRKFDDQLRGVREAARARLTDSGWEPDPGPGDTIPCLSCPCPDFQPGGPQGRCKRPSCRHFLIDHELPE